MTFTLSTTAIVLIASWFIVGFIIAYMGTTYGGREAVKLGDIPMLLLISCAGYILAWAYISDVLGKSAFLDKINSLTIIPKWRK